MTTLIWIEPVKRPDGRKHFTIERGLLLTARHGGPNGDILVEGVHNAVCEACRVLMSRGITGPFETWKASVEFPCMTGDIEAAAGLTLYEPDDGTVKFAKWRPLDQNAVSRSAVQPPAREDNGTPTEAMARSRAGVGREEH